MICGGKLDYLEVGKEFQCIVCNNKEIGYVHCPNGHYICDTCHGEKYFRSILKLIISSKENNPLTIAQRAVNSELIPMLGCEHAWITAGALLMAIKNDGKLKISNPQIHDALNRTRRQAVGAYCGLTGVCGIAPAIGASFSVILGAACPKDKETATTMRVVSKIIEVIAAETGPCCCKNFVYTALTVSCSLAKEYLSIDLPSSNEILCKYSDLHPHGCRKKNCRYYGVG